MTKKHIFATLQGTACVVRWASGIMTTLVPVNLQVLQQGQS
jgi:hypothetical protein